MTWDTKKVIAVAVLVGALTQLGNGLKAASWLIGVPDAAYGGQAVAQKVDEEFKEYLNAQKASTEAIKSYIAAQQQAPLPLPLPVPRTPPTEPVSIKHGPSRESSPSVEELSDDGEIRHLRYRDVQSVWHDDCCDGHTCWPYSTRRKCER